MVSHWLGCEVSGWLGWAVAVQGETLPSAGEKQ